MFCPFCNAEIIGEKEMCPTCGSDIREIYQNDSFIVKPIFICWYEVLNYLIYHIAYFGLVMILGYSICAYFNISLSMLIFLFPLYVIIGYIKTSHLRVLYQGITFTFYKDHVSYENAHYPRLNNDLYYDDVAHVIAYQNFLDYFFGIGHIKIKMTSTPSRGMLLKNINCPNEVYKKIKEMIGK